MVDTYYDKVDRGLLPRPAGYQGFVAPNPVMAPGVFNSAGGGGSVYGAPGRRPGATVRERMLAQQKKLQDEANAANLARYGEGRQLLGMEDPNEWQKQGFAAESAYRDHLAFKAQQEAAAAAGAPATFGGAGSSVAGVAATGGNITPQALASRVQSMQRGIYNSSTALNREAVTNSLAMQDAERANRTQAMQAAQIAESNRRALAGEASDLRGQRLQWIYNRNDQAPNLDRSTQISGVEGEGTTEGLAYPTAQGGGGRGDGYASVPGIGQRPGVYAPQLPAGQTAADLMRQQSYEISRGRRPKGSVPVPLRPGGPDRLPVAPRPPVDVGGALWRNATSGLAIPRPNVYRGPLRPR